jgi:hypothetical protein
MGRAELALTHRLELASLLVVSHLPARQLMQQHMLEIRQAFAVPLAERLGRSATEIHDEGLEVGDFKLNERVEVTLGDGSTMSLRYAFVVMDVEQRLVGIFSEHCGYFCYGMVDMQLSELKGDKVVVRHAW